MPAVIEKELAKTQTAAVPAKTDATATVKEPEKKLAPQEISKEVTENLLAMIAGKRPSKKEKAEPEKAKVEPEKAEAEKLETKAEAEPEKKPDEPAKPAAKAKKKPEIDVEGIASRVAAETAAAITDRTTKADEKKTADAPKPEDSLTSAQRRRFDIFKEMEALSPQRNAGLSAKYLDAVKEAETHRKQWVKENPGKTYDPDADEHAEFFDSIEPRYDDDDYDDARAALREKPLKKELEETRAKLADVDELKKKSTRAELEPALKEAANNAAAKTLNLIDPELFEVAADEAKVREKHAADPVIVGLKIATSKFAGQMAQEIIKVFEGHADVKSESFQQFQKQVADIESQLKSLPAEQQLDNAGRRFATWEEYHRLMGENPANKAKYWFLDRDKLLDAIPEKLANNLKDYVSETEKQIESMAKARGWEKKPATQTTQNGNGEHKETPAPARQQSPSPVTGRTQIDALQKPNTEKAKTWEDVFQTRMQGR